MSTLEFQNQYTLRIQDENRVLAGKITDVLALLARVAAGNDTYIRDGWDEMKREAARGENRLAAEVVAILSSRKVQR